MSEIVVVLTTMPDAAAAETLANTLVEERLAACVNVHAPMTSFYRWQGRVEREAECQLVIKTTAGGLGMLEQRVKELHPYELPEFVILAATGSRQYVAWVEEETSSK
jgi:periplasmic divalent cation tolerance protein